MKREVNDQEKLNLEHMERMKKLEEDIKPDFYKFPDIK